MKYIDDLLNRITMYRLVLYYLTALIAVSIAYGFIHWVPYSPWAILFSSIVVTVVCWIANEIFARIFKAPTNIESVYITAFILVLIVAPTLPSSLTGVAFLCWVSVFAMASKYILALQKKHLFNPTAVAVTIAALALHHSANWWVGGNLALLPWVLVGGLLVVRKIRRFDLVLSFAFVSLGTIILTSLPQNPLTSIEQALNHSPLIFLGTIMLTEPLTSPPTRSMRLIYGAIVGFFFAPAVHIFSFYATPEIALLIGNVFVYIVSPKGRLTLTLLSKEKNGQGVYDFTFAPDRTLVFRPGQYLEWTLPHAKPDTRGNRRYFTIASSPTEKELHLGVKMYEPSSTFKKALLEMKEGDTLTATQLSGDFTLPKDEKQKLILIAGGIGITPFRSMLQYLLDTKQGRDIALFYSNKLAKEVSYKSLFDRAEDELGTKIVYALTGEASPIPGTHSGMVDVELIKKEVPDYRERMYYISGPRAMVVAFEKTLRDLHIPRTHIKVDFFPGFV